MAYKKIKKFSWETNCLVVDKKKIRGGGGGEIERVRDGAVCVKR